MGRSHRPECRRCHLHHYESEEKDCKWGQQRWKVAEGFEIGQHLYACHSPQQSALPYVILTVGIPDALRCIDAGHPAVACFGLDLTRTQRDKLIGLGKHIILGFDNDADGKRGARRIIEEMCLRDVSSLTVPEPYKDLGEMPTREVKELINGFVARVYG
jgi:DNA primase